MASVTHTIKLQPDLAEICDLRLQSLGYTSRNAYIKGLIRADAMAAATHPITVRWSRLPFRAQDQLDAQLLKLTQKGRGAGPQRLAGPA